MEPRAARPGTVCPVCRTPQVTVAGDSACPRCLLKLALGSATDEIVDPGSGIPHGARIDQQVGQYELLDEISRGGMGVVYRARQRTPPRLVAVKMLLPYLLHSDEMRTRFATEAAAAASLDHPGILPVYEVGRHGAMPFFSMKFAEGGSLAQRMRDLRGDFRGAARLIGRVAEAVHHAHSRGIVHRDLKPGNILFDSDGNPMVGDFGVAKWRAIDSHLTLPSAVLGSPQYMAPDQMTGGLQAAGPSVDVYSLGAILYELLCGVPPVTGQSAIEVIQRATTSEPVAPHAIDAGVPKPLSGIVMKCLRKDPSARYASAAELAADLARWRRGERVWALPPPGRARRLLRAGAPALVAGALASVALAWWLHASSTVASVPPRAGDLVDEALLLLGGISEADNERAIGRLRAALEIDPRLARAHTALADAYVQRVWTFSHPRFWIDSAIEEARKAIEQDPDDAAGYLTLGRAYYVKNWHGEAQAALEQALAAPNSNGCSNVLAIIYRFTGRYDGAYEQLRRCIEAEPWNREHPYLLTWTLDDLGFGDEAERWMRQVVEGERDPARRTLLEAETCLVRKDYECAFRTARELPPDLDSFGFQSAAGVLSLSATYLGRYDVVEGMMDERAKQLAASGTDIVRPEIELMRASFAYARGDVRAAREFAQRARDRTMVEIEANSQRPRHYMRMAIATRILGDREGAYLWLAEADRRGWSCNGCYMDVDFEPFRDDPQFATIVAADRRRLDERRASVDAARSRLP